MLRTREGEREKKHIGRRLEVITQTVDAFFSRSRMQTRVVSVIWSVYILKKKEETDNNIQSVHDSVLVSEIRKYWLREEEENKF